jgi:hypothetical protein
MDDVSHVLDPDGDVVLILRNPNPAFAVWKENDEEPAEQPVEAPVEEPFDVLAEETIDASAEKPTEVPAEEPTQHLENNVDPLDIRIRVSSKHLILASPQ